MDGNKVFHVETTAWEGEGAWKGKGMENAVEKSSRTKDKRVRETTMATTIGFSQSIFADYGSYFLK